MLYIDIHIFLRVGVRVHSLSVLLKLRVRAILTEIWIRLHIWDCWKTTYLFILFYFGRQCTLIFIYPVSCCLNLEWFDWLIVWLGWFISVHLFSLVFFNFISRFILAMNLRGCCLSVNALWCFCHNSFSHILRLTGCCILLPTYSLLPLPHWYFLCLFSPIFSSPQHASIHLQNIILPSASMVSLLLSVCYWNVTRIEESMLQNVIR